VGGAIKELLAAGHKLTAAFSITSTVPLKDLLGSIGHCIQNEDAEENGAKHQTE